MNLPNLLTLARIFLVPLLVAALLADGTNVHWDEWVPVSREIFALCVFLAAAPAFAADHPLTKPTRDVAVEYRSSAPGQAGHRL